MEGGEPDNCGRDESILGNFSTMMLERSVPGMSQDILHGAREMNKRRTSGIRAEGHHCDKSSASGCSQWSHVSITTNSDFLHSPSGHVCDMLCTSPGRHSVQLPGCPNPDTT